MAGSSTVQSFLDWVFEMAIDIAERKIELQHIRSMVRSTVDVSDTVENVCRSFLYKVNALAVDSFCERLLAVKSFHHSLEEDPSGFGIGDQVIPPAITDMTLQTVPSSDNSQGTEASNVIGSECPVRKNVDEINEGRYQADRPQDIDNIFNPCWSEPSCGILEAAMASAIGTKCGGSIVEDNLNEVDSQGNISMEMSVSNLSPCIQEMDRSQTLQCELPQARGSISDDELNTEVSSQHGIISKMCDSGPSNREMNKSPTTQNELPQTECSISMDEMSGAIGPPEDNEKVCIGVSSPGIAEEATAGHEWPKGGSNGEETERQSPGPPGCENPSIACSKNETRETEECIIPKGGDEESTLQPSVKDSCPLRDVKAPLQESPKSASIFFRLARELLESGGHQDFADAAQSQQFSSESENLTRRDEESSSCPCRFDWDIGHPSCDDNNRDVDRLDVNVLEMNDVDELLAEDQEVPGCDLVLDLLLDPETEISLYNASDTKVDHSPPLKLKDTATVEERPRQQIQEISDFDANYSPPLELDDTAPAEKPPRQQIQETSDLDEVTSSPDAQSNNTSAGEDVLPGHQWYSGTTADGGVRETVKRAIPIPSCNRRRRVGLSRTQRVPSLHSKRLKLAEE